MKKFYVVRNLELHGKLFYKHNPVNTEIVHLGISARWCVESVSDFSLGYFKQSGTGLKDESTLPNTD